MQKKWYEILKQKYFLPNKFLRRILLISLVLITILPLYVILVTHPSFIQLLIESTKDDAVRVAKFLTSMSRLEKEELTKETLNSDLFKNIDTLRDDFELLNLKVFSKSGKIIFSTDPRDSHKEHQKRAFKSVLTKGEIYTKVVTKGGLSSEGQETLADVVETYIPIINEGKILGAFEIYYDITKRKERLDNLLKRSGALVCTIAFGLLIVIFVTLFQENRSIIARQQAEAALLEAHTELERRVEERTAEVTRVNEQLEAEIEERQKTEEELQQQLLFLQQLMDAIPNPIFYKDAKGIYLGCNSALEQFLGLSKDEIIGSNVYDLAPKEWANIHRESDLALLQEPGSQGYETIFMAADGNMHDLMVHKATYKDTSGASAGLVGVVTDITELKRAEEALRASENKLHMLSSHLLTVQEIERRRLSLELHDDLGQALTFLKLQLGSMGRKLRKDQGVIMEEVESTQDYVDQVIENIRRLSRELSPSALEDLGLSASLRSMAEDFATHSGIETSVDMAEVDDLFPRESQILIYRIFQESLTNIGKHAEARHVSLAIERGESEVTMVVEDDGRGFDTREVEARYSIEKGLGLAAMGERARMLGGSFEISSRKGEGTRGTVTIPIENSN
jgi:PAS domain S-box-containing protein